MTKEEFRKELDRQFAKYEKVVNGAGLKEKTIKTYLVHPANFIKWFDNKFIPGATLKKKK